MTLGQWMIQHLYKQLTEQAMVELMGIVEEEVGHAARTNGKPVSDGRPVSRCERCGKKGVEPA